MMYIYILLPYQMTGDQWFLHNLLQYTALVYVAELRLPARVVCEMALKCYLCHDFLYYIWQRSSSQWFIIMPHFPSQFGQSTQIKCVITNFFRHLRQILFIQLD